MPLLLAFLMCLALIGLFPETPAAKRLKRVLIVRPAELLSALTPKRAARWGLALTVVVLAAVAAPELFALMAAMGDLTIAADIMIALSVGVLAAQVRDPLARLRRLGRGIGACARRISAIAARPRQPRRRRSAEASRGRRRDDPEPGPTWGPTPAFA